MISRRRLIAASTSALLIIPLSVQAAETSARAFVGPIYDRYIGKNGNGVALDSEQAVRRYFEPSLAAIMRKDQKEAERRNEVPKLDFDPFVDGQDWDIAAFDIAVNESGRDKATATVKFNNAGNASTVVLDLVKIKNEWKINDITWSPHEKPDTLHGLYAH